MKGFFIIQTRKEVASLRGERKARGKVTRGRHEEVLSREGPVALLPGLRLGHRD